MGIVIPAPAPFNMRVFKIPVPVTRGGKIFPPYPLRCGYYPRVSVEASFFNIPSSISLLSILFRKLQNHVLGKNFE